MNDVLHVNCTWYNDYLHLVHNTYDLVSIDVKHDREQSQWLLVDDKWPNEYENCHDNWAFSSLVSLFFRQN